MNPNQIAASGAALGLITTIDATDSCNLATALALVRRNSFTTTWRDSWRQLLIGPPIRI